MFLPYVLPKFYEKWPNIHIDLIDQSSDKTEKMLFDNQLDLFIGIKYDSNPSLVITPLLDDKIYLAVTTELLENTHRFPKLKQPNCKNKEQTCYHSKICLFCSKKGHPVFVKRLISASVKRKYSLVSFSRQQHQNCSYPFSPITMGDLLDANAPQYHQEDFSINLFIPSAFRERLCSA